MIFLPPGTRMESGGRSTGRELTDSHSPLSRCLQSQQSFLQPSPVRQRLKLSGWVSQQKCTRNAQSGDLNPIIHYGYIYIKHKHKEPCIKCILIYTTCIHPHPVYTMYTVLVSGNCMESNIKQVHNPFLQSTN